MFHKRENDQVENTEHRGFFGRRQSTHPERTHFWTASASSDDVNLRNRNVNSADKFHITHGPFFGPGEFSENDYRDRDYELEHSRYNQSYQDTRRYPTSYYGDRNQYSTNSNVPVPPPLPPVYHAPLYHGNQWNNTRTRTNTYDRHYDDVESKSDWDHYAVRHQDSLIGDPIPYADDSLQSGRFYGNRNNGSYSSNYPRDYNYSSRDGRFTGPVAFNAPMDYDQRPMRGNYSSGTVIENQYDPRYPTQYGNQSFRQNSYGNQFSHPSSYGYGNQYNNQYVDDSRSRSRWGWGSDPLFRESRSTDTPLLPENPWTHNELGREYIDGRSGHVYQETRSGQVHSVKDKKLPASSRQLSSGQLDSNGIPVPPPLPPVQSARVVPLKKVKKQYVRKPVESTTTTSTTTTTKVVEPISGEKAQSNIGLLPESTKAN